MIIFNIYLHKKSYTSDMNYVTILPVHSVIYQVFPFLEYLWPIVPLITTKDN